MSIAHKGQIPVNKGLPRTDITKQKISEALTKRWAIKKQTINNTQKITT